MGFGRRERRPVVHQKSHVLSHCQQICHLCHPAWACQQVSPSRLGVAGVGWVFVGCLGHNLGHGVQVQGAAACARGRINPEPRGACTHTLPSSLQEMLSSPSRSGSILMANPAFFCTSDLHSAVLHAISDKKSFLRKGRVARCSSRPPAIPGRVTPNRVPLQRTLKIYERFYE